MQSYTLNRPDGALLCRVLEQHTNDAAGAILRLAWMAGLMRDEIQHLTWAQVDLLGEQLLLPDRAVPLAPELAAWLEALRRERNGSSERVVLSDRDQQPLAAQSISRLARAALDAGLAPVLVTVRPDASPELLEAVSGFDARVEIVPAPDAHLGQAESLKAGIRRLVSRFACPPPGTVVLLGDQPLVGAELVRELTAFYLQKPECAAAPACDGVRGNPVILPAGAFGDTLLLSGDKGARGILAAFGLRLMPTNDTAAITDVDTWEAYESLSRAKPL